MLGFRNTLRFVALVAVCLVVASVTATGTHATQAVNVNVNPALNYATFTITSPSSSKTMLLVGTDSANMVSRPVASGTVKVFPLAPGTHYHYMVVTTEKNGRTTRSSGPFNTDGISAANLSATSGKFLLNGIHFFPVMATAFDECPDANKVVNPDVGLGVSVLDHYSWPMCTNDNNEAHWATADELHSQLNNDVWWLQRGERVNRSSDPHTPPVTSFDSLPELLTLQGSMRLDANPTALFPCGAAWNSAAKLYKELLQKTGGADPFVYYTDLTDQACLTGSRMAALFWIPILAGADGLEYVTQVAVSQKKGVNVRGDVAREARLQAQHLDTLYPAIVGNNSKVTASSSDAVIARTWTYGGHRYTVAVNTGPVPVTARIAVGGRDAHVKVFWESRNENAKKGVIVDRFSAYSVHVYELDS